MKKLTIVSVLLVCCCFTPLHAAIISPGDDIWGIQINGNNINVGAEGSGANNWPGGEVPSHIIDGVGQKYLNFGETNTGFVVTPSAGSSIATSITLWTANDAAERDPATYAIWGTNTTIAGGGPFSLLDFTVISSGSLALPGSRNAGGSNALLLANSQTVGFVNTNAYTSYLVFFPTVKNSGSANSMQIAEVQLDGTIVPEPTTVTLLLVAFGFGVLRPVRRRK